jgi:cytochrome P450
VSQRQRIDFDHHSPEFSEHGPAQMAELRDTCPVGWSDAQGGFWAVTRYSQVDQVLRRPEIFSSQKNLRDDGVWWGGSVIPTSQRSPLLPLEMDGPRAVAYRRIVTRWASRTAAERLAPTMDRLTDYLLDRVIESGRMDIIADLGNPLPALVIMKVLGLSLSGWHRFSWPFHTLEAAAKDSAEFQTCLHEFAWLADQLADRCIERRESPGDDAISDLVTASVDGELVSIEDCVQILMTFIGGGVDTTTATLGHALRYLSQHPDQRAVLIDDPDRVIVAVEEFLRVFPPVRQLSRTVTRDTEFGGEQLLERERVLVSVLAANLDDQVFEDAGSVELTRSPNPHVAFGLGVHRCAGRNIARVELSAMLRTILRRIPDFSVVESESARYSEAGNVDGWIRMPATFAPGRRLERDLSDLGLSPEVIGL